MSGFLYDGDPAAVLAQAHADHGATMVVFVPHGFECKCVRSCVARCDCETDADGASMLVQGIKLKKRAKLERLPIAAINGAIFALRSEGLIP